MKKLIFWLLLSVTLNGCEKEVPIFSEAKILQRLRSIDDEGFVSQDSPKWTTDERKAILIAWHRFSTGRTTNTGAIIPRYRVEQTDSEFFVTVVWVEYDTVGDVFQPPPGTAVFAVAITKNWKVVRVLETA